MCYFNLFSILIVMVIINHVILCCDLSHFGFVLVVVIINDFILCDNITAFIYFMFGLVCTINEFNVFIFSIQQAYCGNSLKRYVNTLSQKVLRKNYIVWVHHGDVPFASCRETSNHYASGPPVMCKRCCTMSLGRPYLIMMMLACLQE